MKIILKLITTVIIFAICCGLTTLAPVAGSDATLASVNGGWQEAELAKNAYLYAFLPIALFFISVTILFASEIRKLCNLLKGNMKKLCSIIALTLSLSFFAGCKPPNIPDVVEIDSDESAFVIPLEDETGKQANYESEKYFEDNKVAAKRITINKRWRKTGRFSTEGEWIPTTRVIKVSRTPITRQWSDEKENAIWLESSDSVGFSTGFTCTATIAEKDAAKFLYQYTADKSLSEVIDTEIRGRVQSTASEVSAKYNMDQLRQKKQEIIDAVRADVIDFFGAKGITVTNLGMYGGFTYENQKVQDAIDGVFVAQQEKEVAAAQLSAQTDKNARMKMEGQGIADKKREEAQGSADAIEIEAQAQAKALELVAAATKQAGQDPLFLEVKRLEVQSELISRWKGEYPNTFIGSDNPNMLLNLGNLGK